MSQTSIACFLSAARTGSFSETARELYLTRQAVSKNITELEQEVGFPLFFRGCTPLTLTTAGEKMLSYYSDYDYNISVAKRIFGEYDRGDKVLRIGWGRWFMPNGRQIDAMRDFGEASGVKLNVVAGTEAESLEYLRTGEADVAFISKYVCSMLKEPYRAIALSEEPIKIVVPGSYPLESEEDIENVVRKLPFIACPAGERSEEEVLGRVRRAMMYFESSPPDIVIAQNVETLLTQVMLGNGFSCMPHIMNSCFRSRELPGKNGQAPTATMCMVWLIRNGNREIKNLQDWMIRKCVDKNE